MAGAHSNIIRLGLRFPETSRFRESDLEKPCGGAGPAAAVSPRTPWRSREPSVCASDNSAPSQALAEVKMAKLSMFLPGGVGATGTATSTWRSRVPSLRLPETWMLLSSWGHSNPVHGSSWRKESQGTGGEFRPWTERGQRYASRQITWVPWDRFVFSRNELDKETRELGLMSQFAVVLRRGLGRKGTEPKGVTESKEKAFVLQPAKNPFPFLFALFEGWAEIRLQGKELLTTCLLLSLKEKCCPALRGERLLLLHLLIFLYL